MFFYFFLESRNGQRNTSDRVELKSLYDAFLFGSLLFFRVKEESRKQKNIYISRWCPEERFTVVLFISLTNVWMITSPVCWGYMWEGEYEKTERKTHCDAQSLDFFYCIRAEIFSLSRTHEHTSETKKIKLWKKKPAVLGRCCTTHNSSVHYDHLLTHSLASWNVLKISYGFSISHGYFMTLFTRRVNIEYLTFFCNFLIVFSPQLSHMMENSKFSPEKTKTPDR